MRTDDIVGVAKRTQRAPDARTALLDAGAAARAPGDLVLRGDGQDGAPACWVHQRGEAASVYVPADFYSLPVMRFER